MTNKQITMDNVAVGDIFYSGHVYAPSGETVPKYKITVVAVGAVERYFGNPDKKLTVMFQSYGGLNRIGYEYFIRFSTIDAVRDWA
jgi:hypothetical protein